MKAFKAGFTLIRTRFHRNLVSVHGFTLIELLIVVVAIAVLVSLGFANYRDYSRRQILNSAVRQMEGDIRQAQSMAFAGKKPSGCTVLNGYMIQFNTVNSTYSLLADCSNNDYSVAGKTNLAMPSGITFTVSGPTSVAFKTLGQGTDLLSGVSSTVTFTQKGTGNTTTLVITGSGEVTVNFT